MPKYSEPGELNVDKVYAGRIDVVLASGGEQVLGAAV